MARINSYDFGSITIDGVAYLHDVYILPPSGVEHREGVHSFTLEQAERVLVTNPEVLIIGTGNFGLAELSHDAMELLEKSGVELIVDRTQDIVPTFNQLALTKRVAAIIHLTC